MCTGVHTYVCVHLPEQVSWSSSSVLPRGQRQLRCWSGRDRQMSLHPPLSAAHGSSKAIKAAKEAVKFTLLVSLDQGLVHLQGFAMEYCWEDNMGNKSDCRPVKYCWEDKMGNKSDCRPIIEKKIWKEWLPAFWNEIKTHKRLKRIQVRTVIRCLKRSELVHVRQSPLFETAQVGNNSWFSK